MDGDHKDGGEPLATNVGDRVGSAEYWALSARIVVIVAATGRGSAGMCWSGKGGSLEGGYGRPFGATVDSLKVGEGTVFLDGEVRGNNRIG